MVDSILVDAYGQNMKIKDLASVSVPEARTIKINVWDTNLVSSVEKSIVNSSLNLSPMTEGQVIRINLPDLTAERRLELAKNVKRISEEAKVSIRNIRQDGMNSIKKLSSQNGVLYSGKCSQWATPSGIILEICTASEIPYTAKSKQIAETYWVYENTRFYIFPLLDHVGAIPY